MSRIAFVLDRIFRKFGLSGKSFIPMLIGVGCGVPGVMASRTIENERDRRMTIMTTTFIPCGAKVPFIGMIAGALFGGSAWVSTSAYFIGMAAIIVSGIMLKKTNVLGQHTERAVDRAEVRGEPDEDRGQQDDRAGLLDEGRMNSQKWTWFAIGYQCGFAYLIGLMIYQFGCAFTGNLNVIGLICAILALAGIIYMLVRPYKEATTLKA